MKYVCLYLMYGRLGSIHNLLFSIDQEIGLDLIDAVAFCLLRFISQVVSVYLNTVIQKKSPGDNFYRLILCLTVLFLIALSTYV